MNFIYGLLGILFSFLIVKYRKEIISMTGRFEWAEKYLGSSGTMLILLLLAIFLFFFSFLLMFGQHDILFGGFASYLGGGK